MALRPMVGDFDACVPPVPTGHSWCSVQDMLQEVMSDLHRVCVQDHLFRPLPELGTSVLFSETKLSEAIPVTYSLGRHDIVVLNVSAFTKDDLTAGIEVLSDKTGMASTMGISSRKFIFSHYIENRRTLSRCALALDGDQYFADMTYCSLYARGYTMSIRCGSGGKCFFALFTPAALTSHGLRNRF